jgi:hypothetical protein
MEKEILKSFNRIEEEIDRILELICEAEIDQYNEDIPIESMLNLISLASDQAKDAIIKNLKKESSN